MGDVEDRGDVVLPISVGGEGFDEAAVFFGSDVGRVSAVAGRCAAAIDHFAGGGNMIWFRFFDRI